jgi:hypothetical protein
MAELRLLCEGESDVAVLKPMFQFLNAAVTVESVGGIGSLGGAAALSRRRGDTVATVGDREYRTRAQADAAFAAGSKRFLWRRHSIENYLLQPPVVVEALQLLRQKLTQQFPKLPDWAKALPDKPDDIAEVLRRTAQELAPREALCLALWRLRDDLDLAIGQPVQWRTPTAHENATGCREALVSEAGRLIAAMQARINCPLLAAEAVVRRYEEHYATLCSADYLQQLTFLEEFRGHDLLERFHEQARAEWKLQQSPKGFTKRLIEGLEVAYKAQPNLFGTDDFRDLANGVRALSGLDPVP